MSAQTKRAAGTRRRARAIRTGEMSTPVTAWRSVESRATGHAAAAAEVEDGGGVGPGARRGAPPTRARARRRRRRRGRRTRRGRTRRARARARRRRRGRRRRGCRARSARGTARSTSATHGPFAIENSCGCVMPRATSERFSATYSSRSRGSARSRSRRCRWARAWALPTGSTWTWTRKRAPSCSRLPRRRCQPAAGAASSGAYAKPSAASARDRLLERAGRPLDLEVDDVLAGEARHCRGAEVDGLGVRHRRVDRGRHAGRHARQARIVRVDLDGQGLERPDVERLAQLIRLLAPRPLAVAQHELLDLAGRGLRQLAELDRLRHLEARELRRGRTRSARPRSPRRPA